MNEEELNTQNAKKLPLHKRGISEKKRTVLLVVLLFFAVGFIIWTKNSYSSNFVESF